MQKRMRRKSGRWISLLLSVVLVCSMLPVNAFAQEGVPLSDEESAMELSGIEEETESILPTEDDLILLEEDVQAVDDEEEAPSSSESTVEVAMPEEDLSVTQEEITETNTEMVKGVFASPRLTDVSVFFDLDDGTNTVFYKATVPVGGKITHRPSNPTRDGYLFKGWYSYLDQNNEPVMWDFENDTVMDNMSLWASWEEACIVAFDPDDGTYTDFYKVTVPVGGKITHKPADPTRDGYLFKGWYSYLDQNNEPVMWDFENGTVTASMTLWASWEEACIVAFDPGSGTYTDFYKATVPVGEKITHKPADPTRDGYLFKGWYSYLDQNNEPVMWDFENDTVMHNMSLWASWEEGCFVAFDFNDGTSTEYYSVTVPVGGKITSKPADPTRDGYLFKGWYSYRDQNQKPVMWDFENDTVMHNMSLWASWEEGCFVAFDFNDGTSTEYYSVTVPVGGKILDKPADPTRDGYLFKGWYSYRDQNQKPVIWDFENDTVMHNMSLWAAWEEGCFVAF
ncbi:InlB B-repeat-containing protein, partial [Lacrimispora brassicae]